MNNHTKEKTMKKIFAVITALLLLATTVKAASIDATKAEDFIKGVTKTGIEEIINSNVSAEEKQARFRKLFNEDLDVDFIGKFVLGRYWKTATAAQRAEFIDVYRELNTQTWSQRFDEFKGKTFLFNGTAPSNSAGQIFVNTAVPMDNGAPAKVIWRVKETDGKMKVIDIIIENVSLAINARNEYTAYIKQSPNGVAGLIENLKSKLQ
jgi:phospholipid transport system substrate-binding protein